MKKLFGILALGTLMACSSYSLGFAQQAPQAAPVVPPAAIVMPNPAVNEKVIDIDGPLPSEIDIPEGGTVTFIRHNPWVGTNVDTTQVNVDQGKDPVLHRVYYIREPDAPKGYRVVAQYTVGRKGTGGLNVTHTVVAPGAVPQTVMIKVIAN